MDASKRVTIMFDKMIPNDKKWYCLDMAETFKSFGRIAVIDTRFYPGEENTLLVKPVLLDSKGWEDNLIHTEGDLEKGVISGENDSFKVEVDTPFQNGDRIRIWAQNNSTAVDNPSYPIKMAITYYYTAEGALE